MTTRRPQWLDNYYSPASMASTGGTDFLALFAYSLMMSTISTAVSYVGPMLSRALTRVTRVTETAQVSALDRLLARVGWCSTRLMGPGRLPDQGWHLLFAPGAWLPLVVHRSTQNRGRDARALVYAFRASHLDWMMRSIVGDPNLIVIRELYFPTAYRTCSITRRILPPPTSYHYQTMVVNRMVQDYAVLGAHSGVTAFLCGLPGCGKSTVGELLAVRIRDEFGCDPEVVCNVDLTSVGTPDDMYDRPTETTPIILCINEIDCAIAYAQREERDSRRELNSLANTEPNLLNFLDVMARTPYLFVVFTSNKSLAVMSAPPYQRYTRPGRMDIRVQVVEGGPDGHGEAIFE